MGNRSSWQRCGRRLGRTIEQTRKNSQRGDAKGTHLGFGEVTDPAVDARFEEMDLCEDHLVIQSPQLGQESFDQREGGFVLLSL